MLSGKHLHDRALTPCQEHNLPTVLRAFLRDGLLLPDETAEREACLIEHDVSGATTDRLVDFLRLLDQDREGAN